MFSLAALMLFLLTVMFNLRVMALQEFDYIDKGILELLLSKSDLVVVAEIVSKPAIRSSLLPPSQDRFVYVRVLPKMVLHGTRTTDVLEVAMPFTQNWQRSYDIGQRFTLFLSSPVSHQGFFWRPVSQHFAIQPPDLKLEQTLLKIKKVNSVQRTNLGTNQQVHPILPQLIQAPGKAFTPTPSDDPQSIRDYRSRVEAMQRAGQWRSLPTLRPSKIEALMEPTP
jgi:hypothetical protein